MIREEDVVYAYRFMFGRDPENRETIAQYADQVSSLTELRDVFLNSTEFQELMNRNLAPRAPKPGFQGPPMRVELTDDPAVLDQLFTKTVAQWEHLGQTEPYWSVLTSDRYFIDAFHQSRDAFFATGEVEVQAFESTVARAGLSFPQNARCLELGCGVGRVTAALAKRFHEVVAVDISQPHLDIAKNELTQSRLARNIDYQQLNQIRQISNFGKFDIIYTKIVLQHNTPPVINYLLRAMFQCLNLGGLALFQVPVYKAGYNFEILKFLNKNQNELMDMHYLPQVDLFKLIRDSGCFIQELREDDAIGVSITSISNSVLVIKN
jgi:2-polyprenyl-3-methyl-5-hydroxy-6-metoxy-1,4-benzoquinol methylase